MITRIRRLPPLFWIGLFPVVVLLWVWADSQATVTAWTRSLSLNEEHQVIFYRSELILNRTVPTDVKELEPPFDESAGPRGDTGAFGHIDRLKTPRGPSSLSAWFPAAGHKTTYYARDDDGLEFQQWILPLWWILAGYLPLWLGISWWQAKRRRKIEKEMAGMQLEA